MEEYGKLCLIALLTMGFTVSASAVDIQKNNQWNIDITPFNETNAGQMVVILNNETKNELSLSHTYNMDLNFEEVNSTNISTNTTNIIYNISTNTNNYAQPGTENGFIIATTDDGRDELQHQFNIIEKSQWELVNLGNKTENQSVSLGTSGNLFEFGIDNQGNTDLQFSMDITGNASKVIDITDSTSVGSDTERGVLVSYSAPRDLEKGDYPGEIMVDQNNNTEKFNVSVELVDDIDPEIRSIDNPESVQATNSIDLEVFATDNLGVNNVTGEVVYTGNQNNNSTNSTQSWDVTFTQSNNDPRIWETTFDDTTEIGSHRLDVEVSDASNNTVTDNSTFEVESLDVVNVTRNIEFAKARKETMVTEQGFVIGEETPVTVTASGINAQGDWTILIREPSGNRRFLNNNGNSLTVRETGEYDVGFSTDETGLYNGELNYSLVDQHVDVPNTEFNGEIVNYTLPEAFNKTWIQGSTLSCEPTDTGVQNSSYYNCNIRYPADSGIEDAQIAVSPDYLEDYENQVQEEANAKVENLESKYTSQRIQKWFLVLVVISLGSYLLYLTKIYPGLRYRFI